MDVSGAAKASLDSNQCVSFILRVIIKSADTFNVILRRNDIFFQYLYGLILILICNKMTILYYENNVDC